MLTGNMLADMAQTSVNEQVNILLEGVNVKIERIVSTGQSSPADFWYDQETSEWILLLAGSAGLLFEGEEAPRALNQGDYICIDAHRRHRVVWTDSTQPTVWLAIHFQ